MDRLHLCNHQNRTDDRVFTLLNDHCNQLWFCPWSFLAQYPRQCAKLAVRPDTAHDVRRFRDAVEFGLAEIAAFDESVETGLAVLGASAGAGAGALETVVEGRVESNHYDKVYASLFAASAIVFSRTEYGERFLAIARSSVWESRIQVELVRSLFELEILRLVAGAKAKRTPASSVPPVPASAPAPISLLQPAPMGLPSAVGARAAVADNPLTPNRTGTGIWSDSVPDPPLSRGQITPAIISSPVLVHSSLSPGPSYFDLPFTPTSAPRAQPVFSPMFTFGSSPLDGSAVTSPVLSPVDTPTSTPGVGGVGMTLGPASPGNSSSPSAVERFSRKLSFSRVLPFSSPPSSTSLATQYRPALSPRSSSFSTVQSGTSLHRLRTFFSRSCSESHALPTSHPNVSCTIPSQSLSAGSHHSPPPATWTQLCYLFITDLGKHGGTESAIPAGLDGVYKTFLIVQQADFLINNADELPLESLVKAIEDYEPEKGDLQLIKTVVEFVTAVGTDFGLIPPAESKGPDGWI